MKSLISLILWASVGYILFEAIPVSPAARTAGLCEEIKQELVEGVNRRQLSQSEATLIYERCLANMEAES